MTKKLALILLIFLSFNLSAQEFITIWETNQVGPSADNEITIPTNPAYTTYNYTVDWGDGTSDSNITGSITHTYAAAGSYTVSISGSFPAIYFNDSGDRNKIIEILSWGDIQWQTMEDAFHGCQNLNFDAIDSPDLSQVTSLKSMFKKASSFNGIMNGWDVSTITDISGLFQEAEVFNRPLDSWNTAGITDMSYTFYRARRFNEPLDNWNTSAVTTMEYMFSEASSFNQNINNWNVSNVTNMNGTFRYASNYDQPLNNWIVNQVTDMSNMLAGTPFNHPIATWNVSNVTNMSRMFYQAQFNQPIEAWDVSNVLDMSYMLARMPNFNQPLNGWDVSNVTTMQGMFDGWPSSNTPFNQPLNGWDVSNVTDMSYMFRYTRDFNQPLDNWVVDQVTDMAHMFERALIFNQDISGWNVGNVTDMSSMFQSTTVFNQDISGWNVGNVTDMSSMFYSALVFDQPLNGWDVSKVTTMANMFWRNPVFNQPLNNWDTGEVTTMEQMFSDASNFNQNLATWNISNVTNMANMLSNSGLSQTNYDDTLIGWEAQTVQNSVNLGAISLNYCDGLNARQNLIDNFGWNITGDIVNCSFVLCTNLVSPMDGDTNVPASANLTWAQTPNATGYLVTVRIIRGGVESTPFSDHDVPGGNMVGLNLETAGGDDLLEAGDEVFVTIVPYNDTDGPATGCTEESFMVVPSWVNSPDAFKLTYDTGITQNGTTAANQLKIEANTGFPEYLTYNYSIDWGDDQFDNNVTGEITHTYLAPGTYTVSIIGDFPAPIHGYSNTDAVKLLSIDQWGTQVWQSMERAFYGCRNMEYNATDIPDLSATENTSSMFSGCDMFNGNINSWDVSNIINMSAMFIGTDIFNQPLDNWNVGNVTNMSAMFLGADAFNQNIENWNTSNVTNMGRMFENTNVFNQPLNNWDVSNVTNTAEMFQRTDSFNQPLDNWNVGQVTDMSSMFEDAAVFNQPLDNWDVSNVTLMVGMFADADVFDQPLNSWDVSKVTNMASMFSRAGSFDQPLDQWNVGTVTNMSQMFNSASVFNQNIDSWNVTNVIDMNRMFNRALVYNQPMNSWDVNSVVNMYSMFDTAEAFNQPLNNWDVSAVANMSSMFRSALLFNQNLDTWNVSSVTLMSSMFENASVFNGTVGNWNVASVTTMQSMFKDAVAFDQPMQNWDTGEVLNMQEMFNGASVFNQPIDPWDTSFVTTMEAMFENAIAFDQPLNSWNVASVTTMEKMFKGATTFNQDIDSWNVRGTDTMEEMFDGATAFNQSINSWRVSGVRNMDRMFRNASVFNQSFNRWDLEQVSMQSMFENASALNQYFGDWNISQVSDMQNMLDNTTLSRENYDNTLIAWSEQTLTSGLTLGAQGLPYCDAMEERQSIIDIYGWAIVGDVLDCPIPECTQLTSPLNNDTDVPVNTNITWEPVLYARGYRLTVGTSAGGNDIVDNETINNETFYEFSSDFNNGDIVYVTLIPFNDEGDAVGPCIEESFTISPDPATIPDCTNLITPVISNPDVPITTDLEWNPISNADGYRLTVGTTSGGNDIVNNEDVGIVTEYEFVTDLPENTDIFVTIIPYNDEGDALSCVEEQFRTELIPVPPICTNLSSPSNNENNVPIDANLSWVAVPETTGYLVTVGTTSGGIEIVNNEDVGNITSYIFSDNLQENRTYYVTIIPYNEVGDATACLEESFRTGSTAPTIPDCTSLSVPLNSAPDVPMDTNINWNPIANADGYRITVTGSSSTANNLTDFDVTASTSYDFSNDFENGETVTVTIVPYNVAGDAIGCTTESFTIVPSAPTVPNCTSLTSPTDGEADVAIDASIDWASITNADGYRITVTGSSSTANNLTDFDVTASTSYDFSNDFENGETVTVTIVPYNVAGDAIGCTTESFTIVSSAPTVPNCTSLTSPIDGEADVAIDASISWVSIANADGYRLTVAGSSSTANNLTDFDVTASTSYDFSNDFENGETVTVTIVPYNVAGDAIGCATESFTIVPSAPTVPGCTSLSAPLNGEINVATDIMDITWIAVINADGYRITVSASNSSTNNITDFDVSSNTSYSLANSFEEGETVTVTITPYNSAGDAIGCTSENFTIEVLETIPECTTLVSPSNGATDVNITTDLSWEEIPNAEGYRLSIGTASGTTDILDNEDMGILTSYSFVDNLQEGTTFYVNITSYNAQGDAIDCSEQTFTTEILPDETKYGFSPDGDGINEFWEIKGIEESPDNTVYIYNRWGDMIFQIDGYDNQSNVFRGNANRLGGLGADVLPAGTYFFRIQINGSHNLKKLQGYLVLKR